MEELVIDKKVMGTTRIFDLFFDFMDWEGVMLN